MGVNSKIKGNRFEQAMAMKLRHDLNWIHCWTSRFMGSYYQDHLGIDLTGTPNYNIQCKAVERLSPGYHEILAKMPQDNNTNIILHKKNNKGTVAVLPLDDFIDLVKKANAG